MKSWTVPLLLVLLATPLSAEVRGGEPRLLATCALSDGHDELRLWRVEPWSEPAAPGETALGGGVVTVDNRWRLPRSMSNVLYAVTRGSAVVGDDRMIAVMPADEHQGIPAPSTSGALALDGRGAAIATVLRGFGSRVEVAAFRMTIDPTEGAPPWSTVRLAGTAGLPRSEPIAVLTRLLPTRLNALTYDRVGAHIDGQRLVLTVHEDGRAWPGGPHGGVQHLLLDLEQRTWALAEIVAGAAVASE